MSLMLKIPEILWQEILDHLQTDSPREGCGLLGGDKEGVKSHYPGTNIYENPNKGYRLDPHDQFRIMKEMRQKKEELLAIYHSHPQGPPEPSPTDLELAYSPEVYNLIISLARPEYPLVRNYRYQNGKAMEFPLMIGNKYYETDPRDME